MAWRFKTEAEFIADEWSDQGGKNFYYNENAQHQVDVSPEHFKRAPELTQKQIEDIIAEGSHNVGRLTWTVDMFIDTEAAKLNYICSCRWGRHPLYCKCPRT